MRHPVLALFDHWHAAQTVLDWMVIAPEWAYCFPVCIAEHGADSVCVNLQRHTAARVTVEGREHLVTRFAIHGFTPEDLFLDGIPPRVTLLLGERLYIWTEPGSETQH